MPNGKVRDQRTGVGPELNHQIMEHNKADKHDPCVEAAQDGSRRRDRRGNTIRRNGAWVRVGYRRVGHWSLEVIGGAEGRLEAGKL